jgi:alkaline phosphatase D
MTDAWREPSDPAAVSAPRFTGYPFTLGVASGSPTATGVVLWTRLAPQPLTADGGMDDEAVRVRWEVADDERFARIVQRGTIDALPGRGHTVHVEVDGLAAGRWFFYRFHAGDETSPIGRTRTAPAASAAGRMRFAIGSCQMFEQGYFVAHRHAQAEDLDLMVFVGDYIYESSWGSNLIRRHRGGEPRTVADYRIRHAQYKTDPDLRHLHAAVPWISMWDDHEVDNDYADWRSEDLDPNFIARRAAGYQAYFEHLPLRASQRPRGGDARMNWRTDWGRLASFYLVDGRQHRTPQACPRSGRGGANQVRGGDCRELFDAERTMLGAAQERWLADGLRRTADRWNVVGEATLIAPAGVGEGDDRIYWTDAWDGYPAARDRLLDAVTAAGADSTLMVSGDAHTNFVADLRRGSEIVATEFCGTSITSQGRPQSQTDQIRASNPHIHLADSQKRGYVVFDVEPEQVRARLRVVADVRDRATGVETLATFTVAAGQPGAQRA